MLHWQGNLLVELVLKLGGGGRGTTHETKLPKIFAVLHYCGPDSLHSQMWQSRRANRVDLNHCKILL